MYFFFQCKNILYTNRIGISTEVSQMHRYVTSPILHFLFFLLFHTRVLSQMCQSFTVYTQKICISHDPALLSLCAACLLVKAEWITGWSHRGVTWLVEMILHKEWTVVQEDSIVFFFFLSLNTMLCSSPVQHLQLSICSLLHPQVGGSGV